MTRRGYGAWPSPIDAAVVTAASRGYGALAAHGDALYWIESRPEEGGRGTLIHNAAGTSTELTPAPSIPAAACMSTAAARSASPTASATS